ncbi:DHA2 family efflux MFS transporter permease subunit [Streptomyces sp. T028]|uniref:DHA2 family efflux MFS transporter permease subunit n=1 Tax=Streptomyces sp. T028 TaxID=3394379 RepID=UPI003A84AAB0
MSKDNAAPPVAAGDTDRIGPDLWWLTGILVLGGFATLLDSTIVNVAVGTLAKEFEAGLSAVQWSVTGYLLALCMTIPLSGWAVERFGAKQTWLFSQVVFLAGSLLAGLSWSVESLIVFRVLQGVGGGLVMPVGQSLLAQAAGTKRLGRLMGIVSIPAMFAPVVGPTLGGVVIDHIGWRWIFYLNLPLGLATILLSLLKIDNVVAPGASRLDVLGLVLLAPGLGAFLYGLSEVGEKGGFGNDATIAGLGVGAVLILAFCGHALRTRFAPLMDLRLFRERNFRSGTSATFFLSMAMFGAMIPLPLYFQLVRGADVMESGLLLMPQSLGYFLAIVVVGKLTAVLGARSVTIAGVFLAVAGTIPFGLITADSSKVMLCSAMVVRGFGFGAAMLPCMTTAYSGLRSASVPHATSAFNIFQRIGASVGTAALAVVLQQRATNELDGRAAGLTQVVPGSDIAHSLAGAFSVTFWWALGLTVLALLPCLALPGRMPRGVPSPAPQSLQTSEPAV